MRKETKHMDEQLQERKTSGEQARAAAQAEIQKKPKQANRRIFGDSNGAKGPIVALREGDKLVTDPAHLSRVADAYFGSAWTARKPKTGLYLPEEAPRDYPFSQQRAVDPFTLSAKASQLRIRPWLHPQALDINTARRCLKTLATRPPAPTGR